MTNSKVGDEVGGRNFPESPNNGGGFLGFWKRVWYYLKINMIATIWMNREMLTRHNKLDLQSLPKRSGDVAVITGGGRGIGLEVVKKLLAVDMHVIMGVRDVSTVTKVIERVHNDIASGSFEILPLNLSSLSSVREFANLLLRKESPIHLLINNAGIMITPYKATEDGQESQFQVNYLSHFLLTCILLPKIVTSGSETRHARIVNVSSIAQYGGRMDFEDLQALTFYSPNKAYIISKLAQVVFTNYLANRLKEIPNASNVCVFSVHPGMIITDLYEYILITRLFGCIMKHVLKNTDQGADGIAFAALSPTLENQTGIFMANSRKRTENPEAKDMTVQEKLWDVSTKIVRLEPNFKSIFRIFETSKRETQVEIDLSED